MEEKLKQLEVLLKRQPTLMQNKQGKWVVEYLSLAIKADELLGDTEEEAVDKLLAFLYRRKQEIQNDRPNPQAL
jgi:hypothetical protein